MTTLKATLLKACIVRAMASCQQDGWLGEWDKSGQVAQVENRRVTRPVLGAEKKIEQWLGEN